MPIHARALPYVVVVTVPTTASSCVATKQPRGSNHNRRRQSSSVWFHPASRRNSSAAGRSLSAIRRKETVSIVAIRNFARRPPHPAQVVPDLLSRVGEVGRGGLNRPKLSVPRFHFAPHRTGHTDFPCPALRVCLVASLQALLRGCVQPALTGSGHSP